VKTAKIKCPSCGQEYTLEVGAAATTYRCAVCKAEFTAELIEEEQQEVRQLTLDTPAKWRAMFGTPKQQAVAFWIALAFLVGSLIYPPWYHYNRHSGYVEHPNGWFFIFDTEQGEERGAPIAMQIDYGRLVFQDIIIIALLACLAWAAAKLRLRPFFTALFILSPPVLILMFVFGKPLYLQWRKDVEIHRRAIAFQEKVDGYRKSAERGDAHAQCELGVSFYAGRDVPKDYSEALYWFRKSAERGDRDAQSWLGDCYYSGHGVPQDYAVAVGWYREAAERGNGDAQYMLGDCYKKGQGVAKDYIQADKWYILSGCAVGYTPSSLMTPEQIAEAHRLSREWKPKK
jgi:hypothetical protein